MGIDRFVGTFLTRRENVFSIDRINYYILLAFAPVYLFFNFFLLLFPKKKGWTAKKGDD